MHSQIVCELNPSRRRPREDVEDMSAYGSSSFGEHRNKRLMSGMLTSRKRRPSFPPMATNFLESFNASHPTGHHEPHHSESPQHPGVPQPDACEDTSMDMDMTQSPDPARGPFYDSDPSIAGRVPTPIQPNFMAQARGNSWAEAPGTDASRPNGIKNLGHQASPFEPTQTDRSIPRTLGADSEWNAVRNRRLPSPISEGDDASSVNTGVASPQMAVDNTFTAHLADRLAAQVSITTPEHQRGDPMGEIRTDGEHAGGDAPVEVEAMGRPTTPSPSRKGHTRSRHTIDSWTWQPGMKKTFSMGYRGDCEKCRMKVPGHFNHIIIS